MAPSNERIQVILFVALIFGGFLSYTESGLGTLKMAGYILSLTSLIGLAVISGFGSRKRALSIIGFGCIIGLSMSLTLLTSPQPGSVSGIVQDLLYPITLVLLLLLGFRLPARSRSLSFFVLILAVVNGGVAIAASIGLLDSVPLFGRIVTGRYIFGTQIPSPVDLILMSTIMPRRRRRCFSFMVGCNRLERVVCHEAIA